MTSSSGTATHGSGSSLAALTLGAIGVVYGDIGTSPLYTLKEVFNGPHAVPVTPANVYGILSLVFWALMLVVSAKYVLFIMRADNNGEGGIMALTSLAQRVVKNRRHVTALSLLGVFGAALFYGDGMITPAISILSAIEGLEVATPTFRPYVLPIALVLLVGLFAMQRYGTGKVGAVFGPIMVVWFITLAVLGLRGIQLHPEIIAALNPWWAIKFFAASRSSPGWRSVRWCWRSPAARHCMPTWATLAADPSSTAGSASCCRRSTSIISARVR